MLISLKLLSLTYECVYYRREYNAIGDLMELRCEGLEIQECNVPTDKTQKADEKNGVICPVIIFTLGVMVIKMSKMAHFLYFLLMTVKYLSQVRQNI